MEKPMRFLEYAVIAAVFLLALHDAIAMYYLGGANWDFIAHWLYAKSLINPAFYSALFSGRLAAATLYANSFYFETLRAPLTGIMMVPFAMIGKPAIPAYFAFALLLLLASSLYVSRQLDTKASTLPLILLTPYAAFFLLLLNGTEIVTMSILLVFVAFLLRKSWKAGIILGIAGLAKYPSLIFVLLLVLLPAGQRRKAFLAFVLVTLPWLAFNAVAFHNPVFSYIVSANSFSQGNTAGYFPIGVISQSLWLTLPELIPALAVATALIALAGGKRSGFIDAARKDYRYRVLLVFLAVGLLAWLIIAVRGSINDLPRLGYLVYGGCALLLATAISDVSKARRRAYAYCLAALFISMAAISITWFPYSGFRFYGSSNAALSSSENAISAQGLSNCNIVSNNWVYLIYLGYRAHFPYYYNYTIQHYPVVYFTALGSNNTAVNLANITRKTEYNGFFVALPRDYTC
ncbi:MAG: hypothetical protein KGI06_02800 [Candidatus Micrarchaeota archaeon]|nr:hypothetical protein [Candidatus Micrarchaeota archaeon]